MLDGFIIEQEDTGFCERSRFRVKDKNGAQVYRVELEKTFKGKFVITLTDQAGRVAMKYTYIEPGHNCVMTCDTSMTHNVDCQDSLGHNFGFIRGSEPKGCAESTLMLNDRYMNTQLYIHYRPQHCQRTRFRIYGVDNQVF